MKDWIYFNGNMINRQHVTYIRKTPESSVIELGGIHYCFNQLFTSEDELENEYEHLAKELGILNE